jgi:hypothetical protein
MFPENDHRGAGGPAFEEMGEIARLDEALEGVCLTAPGGWLSGDTTAGW